MSIPTTYTGTGTYGTVPYAASSSNKNHTGTPGNGFVVHVPYNCNVH